MRSIAWVTEALDAPIDRPDRSVSLTGFSVDTRSIEPGQLFVALPGERTDGHRFLDEAFRKGASGALVSDVPSDCRSRLVNCIQVEDPLYALQTLAARRRAEFAIPIIGITGSTGKTTTKELLHAVLRERFRAYRAPGNQNTEIGLPLALLNMPDNAEVGIVEMGLQRPGDIRELCDIARPTIGVLTSIGDAHLGSFPDQAALAREKWALMEALPENGRAVLNLDAPFVPQWHHDLECDLVTFAIERPDVDVGVIHIDDTQCDGLRLSGSFDGEVVPFQTRLLGRHSAYAVLAAIAIGGSLGVPVEAIQRAIAGFESIAHRLQLKTSHGYGLILDDTYNASPAATRAALQLLDRLDTDRRKVAVLGDMRELGGQSIAHHEALAGVIDGLGIAHVWTIGDLALHITGTLRSRYGWSPKWARHCPDMDQLERELGREYTDSNALILVKGSRAMALDRLVERLITPTGAAPRR